MMRRCDDGRVGVAAADERRRSDPGVSETWRFDVADAASGLGVVVRLAFRPAERTAWWWIGAVGCGPPLVALRADDVPIPARGTDDPHRRPVGLRAVRDPARALVGGGGVLRRGLRRPVGGAARRAG